jgi:hypothetical protein
VKKFFSAPVVFFVAGLAASAMFFGAIKVEYGQVDFFEVHGFFFLIFITLFPRLTLLFSSVATGGIFWWLGFVFYPRLLVAILATMAYLQTNPVLVYISWFVAISGELLEKKGISSNNRFIIRRYSPGDFSHSPQELHRDIPSATQSGGDVIEAEFTRKDE